MGLLTHPWSWAFLLVLLPLIIHWLQLRRTQTLYFPGVHRLQHLLASGQNPDRLRHWVLLLLRTLALLFLVLGFLQASRPQKDSSSKPIAVVLDASPSMLESGGWDRALLSLDKWMSQA
ncbi:MAG: BatA domain-containing protein, partial [Bacteroidia bacterium]